MRRPNVISAIRKAIAKIPLPIEVKLFGSEARGDARKDSDIDLLVLIDKENISHEDEIQIINPLYQIELKTGVLINPIIFQKSKWGINITPFYENVMREGIAL